MGFGSFCVVNLFGLRATNPLDLRRSTDPIGPENDAILTERVKAWKPNQIICAWGAHGTYLNRGEDVLKVLHANGAAVWHLGLTRFGQPKHPLYLSYDVTPRVWTQDSDTTGLSPRG